MALPRSGVVSLVDAPGSVRRRPEVVAELVRGSPASLASAAATLASFEVVVVQHEFGIYGGEEGSEVVDLVAAVDAPVVVVLHTVLGEPSEHQRAIVNELARMAQVLVVQSQAARNRLLSTHTVDPSAVRVVPHGARLNVGAGRQRRGRRPVVLTWGLLGPGKGIEFGIEALVRLTDLAPAPLYLVHGRTHPRVLEREGEAYRESLLARTHELGVAELVEFDDRYADIPSVLSWIREADVVLLPYRSRDQVVSGVLVEALASGKPVVATRFPHAEELLGAGSGILVPHDQPEAIAHALRQLLTDRRLHAQMATVAREQAAVHAWENIGQVYQRLAASVVRR
jgi:polysaccharide biosynthesis protein PslF